MGRSTNTRERRDEIVKALIQVMARHGWEGASIARVARAARLTPGLVHYHFTDKREILLEAIAVLEARATERVQRRLAAVGTPTLARIDERAGGERGGARSERARRASERIDAFIDAHLATGRDADPDAVTCWVAIAAESVRDARVRAVFEQTLRRLSAQLEAHFGDVLESARTRVAATAVVSSILGALVVAAGAPGLIPTGSAAGSVKMLARAFVNEEGGA